MNDAYSPQIWQRFRAPQYAGVLQGPDVIRSEAQTPASKAVLRLHLKIGKERIDKARFQALGCPSTIATGDWLCQWLEGRHLTKVSSLSVTQLAEALALVPVRRHCAVLAEDALQAALGQSRPDNDSAGKVSNETEVKG